MQLEYLLGKPACETPEDVSGLQNLTTESTTFLYTESNWRHESLLRFIGRTGVRFIHSVVPHSF